MISSKIHKITGKKPGPTVAIFAGIHGNEQAGVFALQALLPTLQIPRGVVYVAFANPPAIKANARMLQKNMNRCFYTGNIGTDYEDIRARELMAVLDECSALLDLHMFYGRNGAPFVICETDGIDIAQTFDIDIISTNWTAAEPGATDGYMHQQGKLGICVECGPIDRAKDYKDFATKTIYQFLQYFGMSPVLVDISDSKKRIITASHSVYKSSKSFVLSPGLTNFQQLAEGQVLAVNGLEEFRANKGECIIFPHYNARIGEEAYIIGREHTVES